MQIVYHLGVHATDRDRLVKTLLANRETLLRAGVEVPSPSRYRGVIGEALNSLQGAAASPDMQEVLLDAVLDGEHANRMILSQPGFLGMPSRAISQRGLYAAAGERVMALANLFPTTETDFFIALKHPATLIARLMELQSRDYHAVLSGADPMALRWATPLQRIVQAARGRRVVVWCNEDTPLIWPEILRRITGLSADAAFEGDDMILADLLPPETLADLRQRLASMGPITVEQRRAITESVLTSHAIGDSVDCAVSLPGWDQVMVDEISRMYDADIAEIAALPGVEFIAP